MHLPSGVYAVIRRLVPIACVDALPYRESPTGLEVGLIRRANADGTHKVWNFVGGRVQYGETLAQALDRHLRDALGSAATWTLPDLPRPTYVAEYFPRASAGARRDPRKHAIALAYPVRVDGIVAASGEAIGFRWFSPSSLPPEAEIGFDQADVVHALVANLMAGLPASH